MQEYFFHVGIDLQHPAANDAARGAPSSATLQLEDIRRRLGDVAPVIDDYSLTPPESASGEASQKLQQREQNPRTPPSAASYGPGAAAFPKDDCRAGELVVRSVNMRASPSPSQQRRHPRESENSDSQPAPTAVPTSLAADATRGEFVPCDSGDESLGWGVIRLYRERDAAPGLQGSTAMVTSAEETAALAATAARGTTAGRDGGRARGGTKAAETPLDEDCATLCVLAVPSYMTPSDFLGFVGEGTRAAVSHFRMLRTERVNRYMVLMRFRSARRARAWRREWNGRPFNDMESENCHVVFVKSIKFRAFAPQDASFPDTLNDPFAPSAPAAAGSSTSALSSRPMAPPTPALKELPTCPVCLERMDESTGLLTILCRHVFHCSCLQKWRGSGCPVCRYTQDEGSNIISGTGAADSDGAATKVARECSVCGSDANLWACLICGNVGCGRYDGAHAFAHHSATEHAFAMDMATQRVWDYVQDGYVHRILQSRSDGKLLELPSIPAATAGATAAAAPTTSAAVAEDTVPAAKLDALSLEYTNLLTSQLASQRTYFAQKLEAAADKASRATASAERAEAAERTARDAQAAAEAEAARLRADEVPRLERELARAAVRADTAAATGRALQNEIREERAVAAGLLERVKHLDAEAERLKGEADSLRAEVVDLKEQNRDLAFFVSGKQQLEDLGLGEEVEGARVEVPEVVKKGRRGKGKR